MNFVYSYGITEISNEKSPVSLNLSNQGELSVSFDFVLSHQMIY